jgi:hypothetical protein
MGTCRNKLREERGVIFILFIVVLLVLLAFAALALDVGNVMVVRNELQNIADAAALAGARTLGRLYECDGNIVTCPQPMPYPDQLTYVADEGVIKQTCIDTALQNKAGGKTGITINDTEIVIGTWNAAEKKIDPITLTSPDAVQVTARRDASANGPISTFFARIFGINTVDVSATATAALTGQTTVPKGGLPIPVAINMTWLTTLPCNQNLQLYPSSGDICAAWHTYEGDQYQPNGNQLDQLVQDLTAQTYSSPATTTGTTQFDFINGTVAKIFTANDIQELFDTMKVKNDGVLDLDLDSGTWTTAVAVFDDSKVGCAPRGMVTIDAIATIVITNVVGPPENLIYGAVQCDDVLSGRGGGKYVGTKGSIPGLVQ